MFGYLLDRDMLQAQSAHMFVLLCVTNEVHFGKPELVLHILGRLWCSKKTELKIEQANV